MNANKKIVPYICVYFWNRSKNMFSLDHLWWSSSSWLCSNYSFTTWHKGGTWQTVTSNLLQWNVIWSAQFVSLKGQEGQKKTPWPSPKVGTLKFHLHCYFCPFEAAGFAYKLLHNSSKDMKWLPEMFWIDCILPRGTNLNLRSFKKYVLTWIIGDETIFWQ